MMTNIPLRRSIAFLIDTIIISIMAAIFENLLPITISIRDFEVSRVQFTLGISLAPVFYGLYFVVFDIISNGRAIGKLILGILVVSKNGEALSMKKHLLRSLYKTLSVLTLPVAVLLFIFENYTIQDYYADTATIRSK